MTRRTAVALAGLAMALTLLWETYDPHFPPSEPRIEIAPVSSRNVVLAPPYPDWSPDHHSPGRVVKKRPEPLLGRSTTVVAPPCPIGATVPRVHAVASTVVRFDPLHARAPPS